MTIQIGEVHSRSLRKPRWYTARISTTARNSQITSLSWLDEVKPTPVRALYDKAVWVKL
jgi:hypothetical protein